MKARESAFMSFQKRLTRGKEIIMRVQEDVMVEEFTRVLEKK